MPESWTIGSDPECDLVVDRPTVSRRHCRLTREADGYSLDDLGSSNGTYVNGERITTRVRVTRDDAITLGANVPLPWPADPPPQPARTLTLRGDAMVVGRDRECDLVLDSPVVSGRHARLSRSGGVVLIEDLGSSNGTFLNGQRIDRATAVRAGDRIGLGSFALVFADEPPAPGPRATVADLASPFRPAPAPMAAAGSRRAARGVPHAWLIAALVGQVLPVSVAVAMLRGSDAAVLFWLGFAAVWFGLSSAIVAGTIEAGRGSAARGNAALVHALAAGLSMLQCVATWAIVSQVAGLRGPAAEQVALLVLASWVGTALGLVIARLIPIPAASWLLVAPVLLALWALGGEHEPVPRMDGWARQLSVAAPTRWAFEGLLLLEAAGPGAPGEPSPAAALAERYFPAGSEQMGVKADAVALLAMLIGLTAAAAFIAGESRRPARAT